MTISEQVAPDRLEAGVIDPDPSMLREVSRKIASSVIREARRQGLGRLIPHDTVDQLVADAMWYPYYPSYVYEG